MNQKITDADIAKWLDDPVTRSLFESLKVSKYGLIDTVGELSEKDLPEFKAKVALFDLLINRLQCLSSVRSFVCSARLGREL